MKKISGLILFALLVTSSSAQVTRKDTLVRRFQPVVIGMNRFPDFLDRGLKLSHFFLYAYDDTTKSWRPVPFQIDDRQKTSEGIEYVFDIPPDTVDQYDELVFLARDLGDRVPDGYWLSNPESRDELRYEIEIQDTLWQGQRAWGYLFHSSSIADFIAEDYLEYFPSDPSSVVSDKVVSKYYEVQFWEQNGLPIHLMISPRQKGSGIDILDRIKFRAQVGDIKIYGIPYNEPLNVSEENLFKQNIKVIDASVRIVREMKVKIVINAFNVYTYEDTSHFPIYFYPYNFEVKSDNINLNTDDIQDVQMNIKLIRTSMDLNKNATGMIFYNKYNRYEPEDMDNRNRINGMGGSNIWDHTLDVPGLNWFLISGSHGSIFSTTSVPAIGDLRLVYFYDYDYDSGPQTWDGTPDTGDHASWGDSGIRINGNNIQGEFSMVSDYYLLPPGQHVEVGDTLNANIESPLLIHLQAQKFDRIAPAAIADLTALPENDTTISLIWTAPGDDGDSGQAMRYEIHYSSQPPIEGEEELWFGLNSVSVAEPPLPSPAGTEETFTITGFKPLTTYYFAIRTYDEADVNNGSGNASPISNIANATALAVELVNFSAMIFAEGVTLTWNTASEENNYGFEIQRRTETTSFQTIAFIPGHGTTARSRSYSYTDLEVEPGIHYYRLKQIDLNGDLYYSREIRVVLGLPSRFALLQNYPNPFNPSTTLVYELAEDSQTSLIIYDSQGRVMQRLVEGFKKAGRYTVKIEAAGWPSGLYFARLTAGAQIFTRKLIVLE